MQHLFIISVINYVIYNISDIFMRIFK